MVQSVSASVAAYFCLNPTDFERLVTGPVTNSHYVVVVFFNVQN